MWLLGGSFVAAFVVALFDRTPLSRFPGDDDQVLFVVALAGGAVVVILFATLFLFVLQSVTRGRNWARFVLSALVVARLLGAVELRGRFTAAPVSTILDALLVVMQCIAVVLLFLPVSNQWYRSFGDGRSVGADRDRFP
jgi:hypothetical protein